MKLYTEETIKEMLLHHIEFDHLYPTPDEILKDYPPISLPSDNEIEKFAAEKHGIEDSKWYWFEPLQVGAKWMRDKIQGGNK